MWIKIFAVCFGMGVVSGVVMSYQFGTNWSVFSDKIGNVIGPLLGYEVLTAFFLEASFLGIMLFGWGRVSKKMHFVATIIVAVGTVISAFWILSANSWMQTPQGFEIREDGLYYPTSWLEIIFNPSFPYRFFHMVTAAYLTTAFVVAGVAAYYLYRKIHVQHAKIMFAMAMLIAVFVAPLQLLIGHEHGANTLEYQPFLYTILIFLLGYLGLAISLYPWLVPFEMTIWDAAAVSTSQSLLLVGTVIFLPIILAYTAYTYYVFWGKARANDTY